jgi:hypothetical protein
MAKGKWNYMTDVPVPPHGGPVLLSYMVGKSGPFVMSGRFDCGYWSNSKGRFEPHVELFAWREMPKPALRRAT